MLFLMYWELNENISVKERLKAADMLITVAISQQIISTLYGFILLLIIRE